ncbi:MAG: hypothetical protein LBB16_03695 [Puniceicoccales bacterium]|nr:hypothetical protein [Puniceicoccales bacterium]
MAKELKVSVICVHKALGRMKITLKKDKGLTIKNGMRDSVRTMKGQYLPTKKRT